MEIQNNNSVLVLPVKTSELIPNRIFNDLQTAINESPEGHIVISYLPYSSYTAKEGVKVIQIMGISGNDLYVTPADDWRELANNVTENSRIIFSAGEYILPDNQPITLRKNVEYHFMAGSKLYCTGVGSGSRRVIFDIEDVSADVADSNNFFVTGYGKFGITGVAGDSDLFKIINQGAFNLFIEFDTIDCTNGNNVLYLESAGANVIFKGRYVKSSSSISIINAFKSLLYEVDYTVGIGTSETSLFTTFYDTGNLRFRNCNMELFSGRIGSITSDSGSFGLTDAFCFENCNLKHRGNVSTAHGINLTDTGGGVKLFNTKIVTTHASSAPVVGSADVQSSSSVANLALSSCTETVGTVSVDADLTLLNLPTF